MLILSLVLHLGLAVGLTWRQARPPASTPAASSGADTVNLVLLRSFETPEVQKPVAATASRPALAGKVPNHQAPPPPDPASKPALPAPAPSFALVAKMDARLRSLPPEVILSPRNAPFLDGSKGIVFLLDISGSMYEPFQGSTRLAYAREALCHRIQALPDGTPFAVILYAERASRSGPLVSAGEITRDAAQRFVRRDVNCGGGTNLPDGLAWAAQLRVGRVVIVSDGELNMNVAELLAKSRAVLGPKGQSPELNVVAIAPRATSKDSLLMQSLVAYQGGTYLEEALDRAGFLTANRAAGATP